MTNYIFDVAIILILLFLGIKYLKTREYDDRKNQYTEESKRKAALICGVVFIIVAILDAVILLLRVKGIINLSEGEGFVAYAAPTICVLVLLIVSIIVIYAAVLKKK